MAGGEIGGIVGVMCCMLIGAALKGGGTGCNCGCGGCCCCCSPRANNDDKIASPTMDRGMTAPLLALQAVAAQPASNPGPTVSYTPPSPRSNSVFAPPQPQPQVAVQNVPRPPSLTSK